MIPLGFKIAATGVVAILAALPFVKKQNEKVELPEMLALSTFIGGFVAIVAGVLMLIWL